MKAEVEDMTSEWTLPKMSIIEAAARNCDMKIAGACIAEIQEPNQELSLVPVMRATVKMKKEAF